MATNDAAMPAAVRKKPRRSSPCLGPSSPAMASRRASTSRCFAFCGSGANSSLETTWVGIGVSCGSSSAGVSAASSSSLRNPAIEILLSGVVLATSLSIWGAGAHPRRKFKPNQLRRLGMQMNLRRRDDRIDMRDRAVAGAVMPVWVEIKRAGGVLHDHGLAGIEGGVQARGQGRRVGPGERAGVVDEARASERTVGAERKELPGRIGRQLDLVGRRI